MVADENGAFGAVFRVRLLSRLLLHMSTDQGLQEGLGVPGQPTEIREMRGYVQLDVS